MEPNVWLALLVILTISTCSDGYSYRKGVDIRISTYQKHCEDSVNGLINKYLVASHDHLIMAAYFDEPAVALSGFFDYCTGHYFEKGATAMKLIRYQNSRGGTVKIVNVNSKMKWNPRSKAKGNPATEAMEMMLKMEKQLVTTLQEAYNKENKHNDVSLKVFLGKIIEEEVNHVEEMGRYISHMKHLGDDGMHEFNTELQGKKHQKAWICAQHSHT